MGTLGIIVAIVLVIYLAMKGYSIVIIAPIASIIVIITNGMDFFPSLIGTEASFMTGLAEFIINFFAIFLLGAILASISKRVVLHNPSLKKYYQLRELKNLFPS